MITKTEARYRLRLVRNAEWDGCWIDTGDGESIFAAKTTVVVPLLIPPPSNPDPRQTEIRIVGRTSNGSDVTKIVRVDQVRSVRR